MTVQQTTTPTNPDAELKARPNLAGIPVLLISSAARLDEEARALGAAGAFQKPVDLATILSAIASSRPGISRA